jgi:hypothetical protein
MCVLGDGLEKRSSTRERASSVCVGCGCAPFSLPRQAEEGPRPSERRPEEEEEEKKKSESLLADDATHTPKRKRDSTRVCVCVCVCAFHRSRDARLALLRKILPLSLSLNFDQKFQRALATSKAAAGFSCVCAHHIPHHHTQSHHVIAYLPLLLLPSMIHHNTHRQTHSLA